MEFITLEYAHQAKLYVPVTSLNLISRYLGLDSEKVKLHALGRDQWDKEKQKAQEKNHDTAAELLDIYAQREQQQGFPFKIPQPEYDQFCDEFDFEETKDQTLAIEAIANDMQAIKAMDRLVCGDVGFGKTEVAMRAIFIAVMNKKQVAMLVPTTLLAQQHFGTIQDRFASWGINVGVLSRFHTGKALRETEEKIQQGLIDVVVGTHKILQSNLAFKNLGLLVIDEEHRFGVKHKEKLKSLRANLDILTMTATPIPRTLNMAMSGMRDLSIIATPPKKRLPIKTFVRAYNPAILKEALLREILRGGQAFVLHNEVSTIENFAQEIEQMFPEVKVGVAHGQMREKQLEYIMGEFYHKRFHILVCTTIIETGIDIPSANTIVMHRADMLGLAQLHQLRGRVGRSHHQAYAYLLTPPPKTLTKDAHKRLEAIANTTELGAGFTLASHDLEIRGAGALLGEEQSGEIHSIGFNLYMELLNKTIAQLKAEESDAPTAIRSSCDINLSIPAIIDEDYLPDVHLRLIYYKRLASSQDESELKKIEGEMLDRFGTLPDNLKLLIQQTELKIEAEQLGITKIKGNRASIVMEFSDQTPIEPITLIQLIQAFPTEYKLEGGSALKYIQSFETYQDRMSGLEKTLKKLKTTL
jgi:transcription-repair coupling factor (superfamily II helicase)